MTESNQPKQLETPTFLEVSDMSDEELQTSISELKSMGFIRVSQKFSKPKSKSKSKPKEKKGKSVAGVDIDDLVTKLMAGGN